MKRDRMQKAVVYTAVLLLGVALLVRLHSRGGPYFERPQTIVDHVGSGLHETRHALLLLPKAAEVIPRGAHATCFRPIEGVQQYDMPDFFTAVGILEHQWIQPPFTASLDVPREHLVEYVVAVREPFTHPYYKPIAGFPEGWVYKVER